MLWSLAALLVWLLPGAASADPITLFAVIGTSVGLSGASATAFGAAVTAVGLGSTGLSIAQSAGAFDPDPPDIDDAPALNVQKQRIERQQGVEPTLLAGETGLQDTPVLSDTVLGPQRQQ